MSREKVLCGKEEIVRVAVGIVDAEGMEALSIRRIAKELGVASMTIYNYVENLQDIKKQVLLDGFDRLYASIYGALNSAAMPMERHTFCKTISMQVFRFAGRNRGLFTFMFSEGQRLFRRDAEIRPFYAFLEKLMKRAKATRDDWSENETGYKLLEILIFSVSYQYAAGTETMSEEAMSTYMDYYLHHCFGD